MKWHTFTLIVAFLICLTSRTQAQDPAFSQFYANRIYLNPALTGLEGGLTASGIYRMQWQNVDRGFETYGASIELQEPVLKSAVGLTLMQNTEGLAALKTSSVGVSYAYTIPMVGKNLHIGVSSRVVQKTVDWSKIVFSDQLDGVLGNVGATNFQAANDRVSFFDFDLGAVYRFDARFGKKNAKYTRNLIGMSINHAPAFFSNTTSINESLTGLETKVPPRITLHAGSIIPTWRIDGTKKHIDISPNVRYDVQGENIMKPSTCIRVVTYGAYAIYEGLFAGLFYQNKFFVASPSNTNAWILTAGAYLGGNEAMKNKGHKLFLGFSYDGNTTGLGTKTGGTYEVAVRYNFSTLPTLFGPNKKKNAKKVLDCKSFY